MAIGEDERLGSVIPGAFTDPDGRLIVVGPDGEPIGGGGGGGGLTDAELRAAPVPVEDSDALTALQAIEAAVEILDNIVAGNEAQVDVLTLPSIPAGNNNIGDVDIASALPAGNNNIGDVDIASALPAGNNNIGDVDVASLPALPAGTNNIGDVDVLSELAVSTATIQRAAISAASSGDNTLVAAAGAGNSIRVVSLFLVAITAVTVRFESGAGGTALSGVMSIGANGGIVLPYNPAGWFETADNTLLNLELGGAVQVSGSLSYIVG